MATLLSRGFRCSSGENYKNSQFSTEYRPLIQTIASDLDLAPKNKPLYPISANSVEKRRISVISITINTHLKLGTRHTII